LLGVKAVIAKSFERIHRSNLAGMGVLPLQFKDGQGATDLHLAGNESFDLVGLENGITPQQDLTLVISRADGTRQNVAVKLRLDTPIEIEYFQSGGILPYVLDQLLA
jgi:aconitate hydratase